MFRKMMLAVSVAAIVSLGTSHAADKLTIGVSVAGDTNPFYIGIKKGIDAKAKELGVNVAYVTANEVVAAQINGVQDLIARKVDALLVSPIDTVAVGGVYKQAGEAGIPVISMVRFSNSPFEKRAVTMDWKVVGGEIGEWVSSKVNTGEVVMIDGPAGAQLFRDLATGFKDAVAKHPGLHIVTQKDGELTRERGLKEAEDALAAHPDLAVIYGGNDEIALGAAQAVSAAGKTGKVIITGLNGVPPAMKAVKDGTLSLTVDLDGPNWGAVALSTAVAYARGKVPTDAEVAVRSKLVDRSNIDQVLSANAQ